MPRSSCKHVRSGLPGAFSEPVRQQDRENDLLPVQDVRCFPRRDVEIPCGRSKASQRPQLTSLQEPAQFPEFPRRGGGRERFVEIRAHHIDAMRAEFFFEEQHGRAEHGQMKCRQHIGSCLFEKGRQGSSGNRVETAVATEKHSRDDERPIAMPAAHRICPEFPRI